VSRSNHKISDYLRSRGHHRAVFVTATGQFLLSLDTGLALRSLFA
jgi:hypothetical protein